MILRIAVVACVAAAGLGTAAAQEEVKARKGVMGAIAKPWYGVLSRTQRGQMPYDQAAIDAAFSALATESQKIAGAFAPNVQPASQSDYDASPKIWQSKPDFDAKAQAFVKAVADNRGNAKNLDSLKVAFTNINRTCDSCHETYRVKNR